MENTQVVNAQPTTELPSNGTNPAVVVAETTPAPGSKTDSALLLESLREEREKRRALEEELNTISRGFPEEDVALHLAKKRVKVYSENDKEKVKQRVYGYLLRRGFNSSAVLKAIRQL